MATLPPRAVTARYLSLVAGMLGLVVAFMVTLTVAGEQPSEQSVHFGKPVSIASQGRFTPAMDESGDLKAGNTPTATTPDHQSSIGTVLSKNWIESLYPTVAVVWFCGVALLGAWRVAGWFAVQRMRVLRTELAPAPMLLVARRLAERLDLAHSFEILISHFVETPMVIGWLRPVILIPASALSGLAPAQLEAILAHELAHIRRHDYLVNLLQILVETVMFYHPAVWWISSQIRLEREQACDDIAIELCADRREYASALLAIEELRTIGSLGLAARGMGGRQMVARIGRILGMQAPSPQWGLSDIVAAGIVASACVALIHSQITRADSGAAPATKPFIMRNDAPRLSPFTAVRWKGDMPEVQFKGTWYRSISINDISTEKMMAYLRGSNDFAPERHFAEDIVEVLRDMGKQPGSTVKLELETLDTHQSVTIPDAPMTEENRRAVYNFDHPADAQMVPAGGQTVAQSFTLQNNAPRLSPFTAVRWRGDVAEVKFDDKWYELESINDLSTSIILDYLKQSDDFAPQKHFAEDLVEVMGKMGHQPGETVKLELKSLDTQQVVTVPNAPMTQANRRSVLMNGNSTAGKSGAPQSRRPGERGMPFSAVRWHDLEPEVYLNGKWYELVDLNDLPIAKVVTFAQGWAVPGDWRRRFAEDLSDILGGLGQPTDAVRLTLRSLDGHDLSTLKNIPMAPAFRTINMFGLPPANPGFSDLLSKGTETLFSAVRWQDDTAEVQINGNDTWYRFLGVDNLSVEQIFSFAKNKYGGDWKKAFEEKSVELLKSMGHIGNGDAVGDVLLQLRTLDTNEQVELLKRLWPAEAPRTEKASSGPGI
jgi:beta-lactamase regulating signal transducer with metallopeptidase domain